MTVAIILLAIACLCLVAAVGIAIWAFWNEDKW